MIDRTSRDRLALAIRRLGAGRISTDQFCETWYELEFQGSKDAAIIAIGEMIDSSYGDLWSMRFRDDARLTPRGRRFFARCVLFLKSSDEYAWPKLWCFPFRGELRARSFLEQLFCVDLCACGIRREALDHLRSLRSLPFPWRVWPFANHQRLRFAHARPVFLHEKTWTTARGLK